MSNNFKTTLLGSINGLPSHFSSRNVDKIKFTVFEVFCLGFMFSPTISIVEVSWTWETSKHHYYWWFEAFSDWCKDAMVYFLFSNLKLKLKVFILRFPKEYNYLDTKKTNVAVAKMKDYFLVKTSFHKKSNYFLSVRWIKFSFSWITVNSSSSFVRFWTSLMSSCR